MGGIRTPVDGEESSLKALNIDRSRYWIGLAVTALAVVGAAEARADADLYDRTLHSTAWVVSPVDKDKSIRTSFPSVAGRWWT